VAAGIGLDPLFCASESARRRGKGDRVLLRSLSPSLSLSRYLSLSPSLCVCVCLEKESGEREEGKKQGEGGLHSTLGWWLWIDQRTEEARGRANVPLALRRPSSSAQVSVDSLW
jgi:hypothetical protein